MSVNVEDDPMSDRGTLFKKFKKWLRQYPVVVWPYALLVKPNYTIGYFYRKIKYKLACLLKKVQAKFFHIIRLVLSRPFAMKIAKRVVEDHPIFKKTYESYFLTRRVTMGRLALKVKDELKADAYISLLPCNLTSAFMLRSETGSGLVVCDNVENVDHRKHTVAPSVDAHVLEAYYQLDRGGLMDSDRLVSVGDEIDKSLSSLQSPRFVYENFRNRSEIPTNTEMRDEFGIPEDHLVIVLSGSVIEGIELLLEAMSQMRETIHLVGLVRFPVQSFEKKILRLIKDLNLSPRVHFRDFLPYDMLHSYLSSADIGIISNAVSNPNAAVGLPNRLFDFLGAGIPVVSTAMPDVKRILEKYQCGAVVDLPTADSWVSSLSKVAENLETYGGGVSRAREELCWESKEDAFYDFIGKPKVVTFLALRDLTRYQRYIRMAKSLQKEECKVNFFFLYKSNSPGTIVEGVNYFTFSNLNDSDAEILRLGE